MNKDLDSVDSCLDKDSEESSTRKERGQRTTGKRVRWFFFCVGCHRKSDESEISYTEREVYLFRICVTDYFNHLVKDYNYVLRLNEYGF